MSRAVCAVGAAPAAGVSFGRGAPTVQSKRPAGGQNPADRSTMEKPMNRRSILRALGASLLAGGARSAAAAKPSKDVQELQTNWRLLLARDARVAQDAAPL